MLYTLETSKSIERIAGEFPDVAGRHGFGVLGVYNLRQKMNDKGVAFDRNCMVFDVCNPKQAAQVLRSDIRISAALPCRISVYEEGGKTILATLRPTALLTVFFGHEFITSALDVERSVLDIMGELAGARAMRLHRKRERPKVGQKNKPQKV